MRIAQVIGSVTLSRAHPSIQGGRLRLAVPLCLGDLQQAAAPQGEPIVVYDEWSPGIGDRIAVTEGPEASNPFYPDSKPIDAYCAAILDQLQLAPADRALREPSPVR